MPRRRWGIAALLSFGILISYFDRVNLSVSRDALHSAFGISDFTFGILLSAYNWTYMVLQLPSGLLLDRFGVRRVGIISTTIWSVASFFAAISTGITRPVWARFLLGIGEAPTFPGTAKAVGYWFPKSERSLATAMFDSMAKFSSAIGVPVLGLILLHFGWRWNFASTGIVSVLYLAFCSALTTRIPASDARLSQSERDHIVNGGAQPEDAARAAKGAPFFYLLKQPKVCGLALGYGSYNYVFYLLLTWLPTYLSDTHHLDLKHSVFYTSAPWLCATVAELIVGGWLVDSLIRRGWKAARVRRTTLVSGMLLGLGIFGVAYARDVQTALLWITISITGLSIAAPVGWSMPSLIAPKESVGTVGGIMNLSNQIAAIAAPIVTGYIVTVTKSYSGAFVAAAIVLAIGIAAYVFLLGDMEAIAEPGQVKINKFQERMKWPPRRRPLRKTGARE